MPRRFFRKVLPSNEWIRQHRFIARFGALLHHPNLWHLNRHSAAGGMAAGLFAGLVPGSNPVQFAMAALLAIAFRVNLPVAVIVTLYTNPFTIVPIYLVAYTIGAFLLPGEHAPVTMPPALDASHLGDWLHALGVWAFSLGKPLVAGLVALALSLAALGYAFVQLAWRAYVILAWRRRKRRMRGM
jgi:uncharacterized protein